MIGTCAAQGFDRGLHLARGCTAIATALIQLGLVHAGHGIQIGRAVFVVGVGAFLGALQIHALGGDLPGLGLVGHPVPAMPVAVGINVFGQSGQGLGGRQQQRHGRGWLKAKAALDIAEGDARRRLGRLVGIGLKHGLAVGLQEGVGGRWLVQQQPEIMHTFQFGHAGGRKLLLVHQLDSSGDAVGMGDGGAGVVVR